MALVPASSHGMAQPASWTVDADGSLTITHGNFPFVEVHGTGGNEGYVAAYDDASGKRVTIDGLSGALAQGDSMFLRVRDAGNVIRFLARTDFMYLRYNAAPADGSLAAGQCAIWFDQTNGAAKLMLKGKTADGTVVTAAVALA